MRGSEGIWRWIVVRRRRIVWRAAFVGAGALLLGTAVLLRRRSFWATDGVLEKATEGGLVLVAQYALSVSVGLGMPEGALVAMATRLWRKAIQTF